MKNKLKLGQKVIVNTGGNDTVAFIDLPIKNIHGFYWKAQNLYLCRFTDNSNKLLCNGAITREQHINENKTGEFVTNNAQYIPADCIKAAD